MWLRTGAALRPVLQRGQEDKAQAGSSDPTTVVAPPLTPSRPPVLPPSQGHAPPSALPIMPWAPQTWTHLRGRLASPPSPFHPASQESSRGPPGRSSSREPSPASEREATPGVRHSTPKRVHPQSHTQRTLTQGQLQTQLSPSHLTCLPVQPRAPSYTASSSFSPSSRSPTHLTTT